MPPSRGPWMTLGGRYWVADRPDEDDYDYDDYGAGTLVASLE
jgi:hypothetical protein